MQPDTFCFVRWISRKWRKENTKLHIELHCSTLKWSHRSIFIHFQRTLNLLPLQMTSLEGRVLWVKLLCRVIALQNFVMGVPYAFINIPAEQKYVCFPLSQKNEILHTQPIYISKSVLHVEMVLWGYIFKSRLMALLGRRVTPKFKHCSVRITKSFLAIIYNSQFTRVELIGP